MSKCAILVDLTPDTWRLRRDSGKGGWMCDALGIPGATFLGLRNDDREVDPDFYEVHGKFILWKGGSSPSHALQAEIYLRKSLMSRVAGVALLTIGLLGGWYLSGAPKADQAQEVALAFVDHARVTVVSAVERAR